MGNCVAQKKEKINRNKQIFIGNHKVQIDLVKLLNCMKSPEIEQIMEKTTYMCRNQKKTLINYQLFLEIFPKLKKEQLNFGIGILKTFFAFFDQSKDGLISQRELLNSLSIIYNTNQKQFIQILLLIFGISKNNITDLLIEEFKLRTKQLLKNRKSNKQSSEYNSKINNYQKLTSKNMILLPNQSKQEKYQKFVASIPNDYDLQQYKNLFDLINCDQQKKMIEDYKFNLEKYITRQFNSNKQSGTINTIDLEEKQIYKETVGRSQKRIFDFQDKNNIERLRELNQDQTHLIIKIKINEPVFLVEINWFNMWRAYLKKFSILKIQFDIDGVNPENKENIYIVDSEQTKEKKREAKPGKIQNYKLLGEYQGQLKSDLKIFRDFVIFPKQIWECIEQLYKIETVIQRKNPEFYPLIIYRVFTIDGKFVEQKKQQYSLRKIHKVKDIFVNQKNIDTKSIYITQQPTLQQLQDEQFQYKRWRQIDPQFIFPQIPQMRNKYEHQFITCVQQEYKQVFQENYLSLNQSIAYGDFIEILFSNKSVSNLPDKEFQILPKDKKATNKKQKGLLKKKKQKEIIYQQNQVIKQKLEQAKIVQIKNNTVKVHFKNKKYYCDKIFSFIQMKQIKKSFKKLHQIHQDTDIYAPKFLPIIPIFKKINNPNRQFKTSYVCSILRCLMQSNYFKQLLLKRKYRIQNYKGFQFANTLIHQFSIIARKNQQNSSQLDYSDFYTKMIDKMPEFNDLNKQYPPDQFLKALLTVIDNEMKAQQQRIYNYTQQLQMFAIKENEKQKAVTNKILQQPKTTTILIKKQAQQSQSMFTDQDIIKRLFMFQYNETRSCNECKNFIYSKSKQYVLNLKINQDQEIFFQGMYHPLANNFNQAQRVKFGILIKLGKRFIDLANAFLDQIRRDHPNITLKNLHFALQKSGEFKKHFVGQDFDSTLKFLNLKRNQTISIYQIKQIIYSEKELQQQTKIQNNRKINYQKNSYVDIKNYSQWKIAKLIQIEGDQARIKNYEYPKSTKVSLNKILPFKVKTFYKTPYIIEIVHRRIKDEKVRHNIGINPFVIYVTELMTIQQIERMVVEQLKKYKQVKVRNITMINSKSQHKIGSFKHRFKKTFRNIQQQKVNQNMILEEISKQKYNIRYLKQKTGDLCYFCNKKSKIYFKKTQVKQDSIEKKLYAAEENHSKQIKPYKDQQQIIQEKLKQRSQAHLRKQPDKDTQSVTQTAKLEDIQMNTEKFCLGTHICEQTQKIKKDPIGCHVDLKKFCISIDWQIQIFQDQPIQDSSYQTVKDRKQSRFSQIYDSFTFLQSKIEDKFQCEKCKFHQSSVRRYISVVPNILIINFERFLIGPTGCDKLDNKIQIKQQISLKIITNPVNNQDIYQLYSIVCCKTFNSDNQQNGYYYCYYLAEKNHWIRTDNQTAYYQDLKDIKHDQIMMLFYRKKIIEGYLISLLA